MKAVLSVRMDNEAFSDGNGAELARILREIARRIEETELSRGDSESVRDYNGNTVGELRITR